MRSGFYQYGYRRGRPDAGKGFAALAGKRYGSGSLCGLYETWVSGNYEKKSQEAALGAGREKGLLTRCLFLDGRYETKTAIALYVRL